MADYSSNKQQSPQRKKRSGVYKNSAVKSSDFLPKVFQTPLNKKWLNATFDQMISKGDLIDVDEFVGSRSGRVRSTGEIYQSEVAHDLRGVKQLEPAIVSRDANGKLTHTIGVDDIANRINLDITDYNYNAAYSTQSYTFLPPINVDKFLNFSQYYWEPNLPVYKSTNTLITYTDVVAEINKEIVYEFSDDNNTFDLHNGMLIKFESGYGAWDGYTVLVSGVGHNIKLITHTLPNGKRVWMTNTVYTPDNSGFWNKSPIVEFGRNQDVANDPFSKILNYNSSVKTVPMMQFYDLDLQKYTYIKNKQYCIFTDSWIFNDPLDAYRVFSIEADSSGNVITNVVIDARDNNGQVEQFLPANINVDDNTFVESLQGWDTASYDNSNYNELDKDYIVVDRQDPISSAWSRTNSWVHLETLEVVAKITNTNDILYKDITERQAKRPILEFNHNLQMFNHGNDPVDIYTEVWKGPIEFVTNTVAEGETLFTGAKFIVLNDNNVYESTATGSTVVDTMTLGDTALILNGFTSDLDSDFSDTDVYFNGTTITVAQTKQGVNQQPLYRLYDRNHVALDNIDVYPNSDFAGNKIFGYKTSATGTVDPELGIRLAYKDTDGKAEIVFENFLQKQRYYYTKKLSGSGILGQPSEIPGMYAYIRGQRTQFNYVSSNTPLGAKTEYSATVVDSTQPMTIPVGTNNWQTNKEFLVYAQSSAANFSVKEIFTTGVYQDYKRTRPALVVQRDQVYKMHDLIGTDTATQLDITDKNGTVISFTRTDENNDGYAETIEIDFSTLPENVYYYGYGVQSGKIVVVDNVSQLYHKLYIDGKFTPTTEYTITNTQITVPASLLSENSIVDVEYYSNEITSPLDTHVPEVHSHNAKNEPITEFTISETLDHWTGLLQNTFGFTGDSFGYNNAHRSITIAPNGGTIHMHNDISIMHDLTYSDKRIDVEQSLLEQGSDWDNFKTRLTNVAKRLYQTNSYNSVYEIVEQAMTEILLTRTGTQLHADSNMAYVGRETTQKINLTGSNQTFNIDFTVNSSKHQTDHLYLYLTDYVGAYNKMVTRILVRDVDYTITGSEVTLLVTAIEKPDELPYITAVYHEQYKDSYVPASMVKLGMGLPQGIHKTPTNIRGHDGYVTNLNGSTQLFNMDHPDFNLTAAVAYELEARVWAGLSRHENYSDVNCYLPSQHHSTWYTLETMDNLIERHWQTWLDKNQLDGIPQEDQPDVLNPFEINYSSIELGEHFTGNRLPGHYMGAYVVVFGVQRPDLMPWKMLGFAFKPQWWDDHYTWLDTANGGDDAKRASLILALSNGTVSKPGEPMVQNTKYARYYWDWANHCPVLTDGTLDQPTNVLGVPDPSDAVKPFVFGDYSQTERKFRADAKTAGAVISALCKLNVTTAWSDFFQPGYSEKSVNYDLNTSIVDNTLRLFNPSEVYYHGSNYGKTVTAASVKSTTPGMGLDTYVRLLDTENKIDAKAVVTLNSDQSVHTVNLLDGGIGYNNTAVADVVNVGSGRINNSHTEVELTLKDIPYIANGINVAQYNSIIRNGYKLNLAEVYTNIGTQLLHKMGAFTDQSLLQINTESSLTGSFKINDNDYEVITVEGQPTRIDVASNIIIEKTSQGFKIFGLSNSQQQFTFVEPVTTGANPFTNITLENGAVLKKYNQYTVTPSYLTYGSTLAKIQDVYSFIVGNWTYLERRGVEFSYSKFAAGISFAEWATTASNRDVFIVELGSTIKYNSEHGHVAELNSLVGNRNSILDELGVAYDIDDVTVSRSPDSVAIETKLNSPIGSVGFAEIDYEHGLLFNNTTQFNRVIFDDVKNLRHQRLYVKGAKTANWTGYREANGYLVQQGGIVQNFDTSVNQIDYYYRTDTQSIMKDINTAERLANGSISRDWINKLNLDPNTVAKFYKGVIRDKGTNSVINKINRSNLVNLGASNTTMQEEWMFYNGLMGDDIRETSTEIMLTQENVKSEPRTIDIMTSEVVNNGAVRFAEVDYADGMSLNSGGPLKADEAEYIINSMDEMSTVFDDTAEYATIPTWNGTTSYKRNDKVRHNGKLYQCNQNFIGFTNVTTSLVFLGNVPAPTFSHASQANGDAPSAVIDGTSIWFDNNTLSFNPIVVTAANSGSVQSPNQIIIDGNSISLQYQTSVEIVDTTAPNSGNPYVSSGALTNPAIADNTDMSLDIDGVTVSLVDATFPAGSALTIQDVVNFINTAVIPNVQANIVGNQIEIVKNVNGNVNGTLTIGQGLPVPPATNPTDELGFVVGSQSPTTIFVLQDQPMDTNKLVELITGSADKPVDISAANVGGLLQITKAPTANSDANTVLTIAGTANTILQMPTSTPITFQTVDVNSDANSAVQFINNAGIPGVSASVQNGRIEITSSNQQLDLGDITNELNTQAGLPGGIQYQTTTVVENTFDQNDWNDITSQDPALFNIWTTNDKTLETTTIGSITNKFWGWNTFQVMNTALYTQDVNPETTNVEKHCSICAGDQSVEGNDARVTTHGIDHNLQVGDYVMIVNSTTEPSVDGIHKVTRVGDITEPYSFYIDQFIESCGASPQVFVIRNSRFGTAVERESVKTGEDNEQYYKFVDGNLAFTQQDTMQVHRWSQGEWILVREQSTRPVNDVAVEGLRPLKSAVLWDGKTDHQVTTFEIYDPLRGIFPGVVEKEITFSSDIDQAVYTDSTDLNFTGNDRNAWGEEQVGKVWWDTSLLTYWDYDQGDADYAREYWGKQMPGSQTEIYEWTKSNVPPEDYATAVEQELDMFGVPATGVAYAEFDPQLNENVYYYTQQQEYNNNTNDYKIVYYFWVKDKNYLPNKQRTLTTTQIADIIRDPSASGINWVASHNSTGVVIGNSYYYCNNNTVLQLNLDNRATHNNWFVINEGDQVIPEYWYVGLRDNVTGQQSGTLTPLPNPALHVYNRYGDDRTIAQGWYTNNLDARREAVISANLMLKEINLLEELPYTWDRTIGDQGRIIDIEVDANNVPTWESAHTYNTGDRVVSDRAVYQAQSTFTSLADETLDIRTNDWRLVNQLYDLTEMWNYTAYQHKLHPEYKYPTLTLTNAFDVASVDINKHTTVLVSEYDNVRQINRDETYNYINGEWLLTKKNNSTIEFNDTIYGDNATVPWWPNGYHAWDSIGWDRNTKVQAYYFVTALREDIFIRKFKPMFNKFFFDMVKYGMSVQKQVDWVYKTTYIQVNIENTLDVQPRRYKRNTVEEVLGYVNTLKPFHTKVRNLVDNYSANGEVTVTIEDDHKTTVIIDNTKDLNDFTEVFTTDFVGTSFESLFTEQGYGEDNYQAPAFTDTTPPQETLESGEFLNAYDWNYTGASIGSGGSRRAIHRVMPQENISILVTTNTTGNTVDTDTRTFVYVQDHIKGVDVYSLTDANTGTLATDLLVSDDVVFLATGDGAKFNALGGKAWINGEIIEYHRVNGDTLYVTNRGTMGTFTKSADIGDIIVDITDTKLDSLATIAQPSSIRFNDSGKSLLDNTSTNLEPIELQNSSQGTVF